MKTKLFISSEVPITQIFSAGDARAEDECTTSDLAERELRML